MPIAAGTRLGPYGGSAEEGALMSLAAGTRLGPYQVTALMGAGGMGEVYRARDTRLDRTVAIKILPPELAADPDRRARFEREARAISQLTHPHICTLYDIGEAIPSALRPTPSAQLPAPDLFPVSYLVMEYLEGETLAARLDRGPLPLAELQPLTPPALDRVVGQCLEKDPDERWQSAHDIARELEWISTADAGLVSSVLSAKPVGRRRERLAWVVAGVMAVAALAVGAATLVVPR